MNEDISPMAPFSKYQRTACIFCKKRRKKCDGGYPSCGMCKEADVLCTVIDPGKNKEVPKNCLELLEEKLQKAQDLLKTKDLELERLKNIESTSIDPVDAKAAKEKDISMDVGFISLTVGGEPRYIGPSSGYSLARMLTKTLYSFEDKVPSKQKDNIEQCALDQQSQVSFTRPSRSIGRAYLETYLSCVQYQYPFLDFSCVENYFDKVYTGDADGESNFFVYMVFAIATQLIRSSRAPATELFTKLYYERAMEHFESIAAQNSLQTVQAFLLQAIFSQHVPNGISVWHSIGLAIRTAAMLGLHRTFPARRGTDEATNQCNQDIRSRIFWSAYGMERIIGLVLGRPFSISDADIDAPFPSNDGSNEHSVANHVFKLRNIQSNICSLIYKPVSPLKFDTAEEVDATRWQIIMELDQWKSTFPVDNASVSTFQTGNWSSISYHNSILLLLRPAVLEVSTMRKETCNKMTEWFKTYTYSASALLLNYKALHARGKLSYTWLALHCVFMTGVTFLYCIWLDLKLKCLEWPRQGVIYDTIFSCANILYVLAEKWESARAFRDMFDRMNNVVMGLYEGSRVESMENRTLSFAQKDILHPLCSEEIIEDLPDGFDLDFEDFLSGLDNSFIEKVFPDLGDSRFQK